MIENIRRTLRRQREINLDRMSLVRTDADAIFAEGKPLLIILGNDAL